MPVTSGHELSYFGLGFVAIFRSPSMAVCLAFMIYRQTRENMTLNPIAAVAHSRLLIGSELCAELVLQHIWFGRNERVANFRWVSKALRKECTI